MKDFSRYRTKYRLSDKDALFYLAVNLILVLIAVGLVASGGFGALLDNAFYFFAFLLLGLISLEAKTSFVNFKRKKVYIKRRNSEMEHPFIKKIIILWGDDEDRIISSKYIPIEQFSFKADRFFDPLHELRRFAIANKQRVIIELQKNKNGSLMGYFAKIDKNNALRNNS